MILGAEVRYFRGVPWLIYNHGVVKTCDASDCMTNHEPYTVCYNSPIAWLKLLSMAYREISNLSSKWNLEIFSEISKTLKSLLKSWNLAEISKSLLKSWNLRWNPEIHIEIPRFRNLVRFPEKWRTPRYSQSYKYPKIDYFYGDEDLLYQKHVYT